jgi:hypothetical protein
VTSLSDAAAGLVSSMRGARLTAGLDNDAVIVAPC